MQTLAQWRARAGHLEIIVAGQQQRMAIVEARLSALQAASAEIQEQLEWALNDQASLLCAAKAILGANGSDEICREFIAHMNSMIRADSTTLYLIDHDKQLITQSIFHRRPEAANWNLDETRLGYPELMTGLSGQVLRSGQPVLSLSPDDGLEPRETLEKRRQSDSGSLIIIPLIATTGILGTVTAHNRRMERVFTPRDMDLLMTLAHQAAAAIERAQLTDEIKRLANTDTLTSLLCRRECLQLAQRELSHCQRVGQPASIFMLDVDHFKRANDTHGHPIGDAVLRGVGEQCLALQRPYDIFGRYGGDEFFAFFPETTVQVALQIAGRISERIASLRFATDSAPISVTLSVGIAISSATDDTLEMLIMHADQALYRAKQTGRNRVTIWSE